MDINQNTLRILAPTYGFKLDLSGDGVALSQPNPFGEDEAVIYLSFNEAQELVEALAEHYGWKCETDYLL
jgi:hypothetical protein